MSFEELFDKWADITTCADIEYAALLEELMEDLNAVARAIAA